MSDNKENRRKCFMCGSSPSENENVTLFRFPKPGKTNILRCELWAKYCLPEGQYTSQEFQKKLYNQHLMLCNKHFKKTSFSDYPVSSKKLHRFAVPDDEINNEELEQQCTSRSSVVKAIVGPCEAELPANVLNIEQKARKRKAEDVEKQCTSSTVGVMLTITGPSHSGTLALRDAMNVISIEPETKKRKTQESKYQCTSSSVGVVEAIAGPSNAGSLALSSSVGVFEPIAGPSNAGPAALSSSVGVVEIKAGPSNAGSLGLSSSVGVFEPIAGPSNAGPAALSSSVGVVEIKAGPSNAGSLGLSSSVGVFEPIPGPSNAGPQALLKVTSVEPKCRKRKAESPRKLRASSSVFGPPHVETKALADITNLEPQAKKRKAEVARSIGAEVHATNKCSPRSKHQKKKHKTSECDTQENKRFERCLTLMKKICQLRNKIYRLKNKKIIKELSENDCIKKISKKLTPTFSRLLQGQIKNFKKKATGRRWTTEEKIVALRLFKRSPTCYRLLRRLFFLPAPSTLKVLLRNFPMRVGVNQEVLNVLKKFVMTQKPSDNEYILSFDEMSIRKNLQYNQHTDNIEGFQDHGLQGRSSEIATHGLVFMVAGIRKKIKQPIAYYLSGSYVTADRLAVLIKEVIRQCFSIGLNVSATVCDMDGVNRRALTILGATMESPTISIDNREIVTLYDPPHLLKCFRNLFLKYNLKCQVDVTGDGAGRGIAKWEHIRAFYELDNTNPNFVFAPCLKEDHLNPNSKQKMKVKLAAQVLSHSVAAGMYAKISQGELTTEAVITANVVANMDRLFDSLNSDSADLRRGKPYATNLKETTRHLKFFKEMKNFFKNLEFVGARATPPSKDGWIWTLNAVEKLWNVLTNRHPSIQSLATRRLQQDPLENLFGCIRSNCGDNCNPTVSQFIAGLKSVVIGYIPHLGTGSNCEVDSNNLILDNYKTLMTASQSVQDLDDINVNFDSKDVETLISRETSDSEMQACAYVTGFIYKHLNVECSTCKDNLLCNDQLLVHTFIENREYNENKKSLNYVSEKFILCVEQSATICNDYLKRNGHLNKIKQNITEIIVNTVDFDFLKGCNLHFTSYMLRITNSVFFICVKRFCVTRNRCFANEASQSSLRKKQKILAHK